MMKLLPLGRFTDRLGKPRDIAGCSIVGRFDFRDSLQALSDHMENVAGPQETLEELYERDPVVRDWITHLLELNGINPEWVNLGIVTELLFARIQEDGQPPLPGLLVELNQPKQVPAPRSAITSDQLDTLEAMIAAISLQSSSITEAIELANTPPAESILNIVEARARFQMPPEEKAKETKAQKLARLKERYHDIPKTPGPPIDLPPPYLK